MNLDLDDLRLMLDEVDRFTHERLIPATRKFETAIDERELDTLTEEAQSMGLLRTADADEFGLWCDTEQSGTQMLSIGVLERAAAASAGMAFAWHRASLAAWLAKQVGMEPAGGALLDMTLLPQGRHGLARDALGAWLGSAPTAVLTAEDSQLLSDWLDSRQEPAILWAPRRWQRLIYPQWREGGIVWQCVSRGDWEVRECSCLHGFDELAGFELRRRADDGASGFHTPDAPKLLYERLFKLDQIGLLAIASGLLQRGMDLAVDYAGLRRQGGQVIARHAAVQDMLAEIRAVSTAHSMALRAFERPLDHIPLTQVMAARMSLGPQACAAAHQVIQVHGGIGYMRETGPEKIARDQNMLRLAGGGVRNLGLMLAGLSKESL